MMQALEYGWLPQSPPESSCSDYPEVDKRKQRAIKNRESAQNSRKRHKAELEQLHTKARENDMLREKISELEAANHFLRMENMRLKRNKNTADAGISELGDFAGLVDQSSPLFFSTSDKNDGSLFSVILLSFASLLAPKAVVNSFTPWFAASSGMSAEFASPSIVSPSADVPHVMDIPPVSSPAHLPARSYKYLSLDQKTFADLIQQSTPENVPDGLSVVKALFTPTECVAYAKRAVITSQDGPSHGSMPYLLIEPSIRLTPYRCHDAIQESNGPSISLLTTGVVRGGQTATLRLDLNVFRAVWVP